MSQRWNPWAGPEYSPAWPQGIPQYTNVRGIYRLNWKTPEKGKPESMNPKLETVHSRRFGFAQMWRTPRGVGYYGGNLRASDGGWIIRVRWDEREPSLGFVDYRLDEIKPIYTLPSGKVLPLVWRKEGHMKSKRRKPVRIGFKMVGAEKKRPALGLRVNHTTHGPGTVVAINGISKNWYAEVRFDAQPFGPVEHPHEYTPDVFYGSMFDTEAPATNPRRVMYRKPDPKYPSPDLGRTARALEEARARRDRDATEFYVNDDGKLHRRSTRAKKPSGIEEREVIINEKL